MLLHDFLEFYARERPDVDFGVMGDRRITYTEANSRANRLANAFIDAGLQKGDRFAYLSKNSLEYPIAFFAASKAGVVPVTLNYRLAPPEWAYIVNDSQSKMLISSGEYIDGVDGDSGAFARSRTKRPGSRGDRRRNPLASRNCAASAGRRAARWSRIEVRRRVRAALPRSWRSPLRRLPRSCARRPRRNAASASRSPRPGSPSEAR